MALCTISSSEVLALFGTRMDTYRWGLFIRTGSYVLTFLAADPACVINENGLLANSPKRVLIQTQDEVYIKRPGLGNACMLVLMERETGFEPATPSLGSWNSTTELFPQMKRDYRASNFILSITIEEGPEMSRALDLLRNAEISGEVGSEEEARAFLSQIYLDSD